MYTEGAVIMAKDTIITIGRQCGSGGREVGIALSKDLEIPYYDKELLKRAAKESGLCEEVFEKFDEKPTSSLLYSIVMDPYSLGISANGIDMPINHKVFLAAFDTIKKVADEGPCVMIGRCADYALSDYKNVVNFFLFAPLEERIKRVSERKGIRKRQRTIYRKQKNSVHLIITIIPRRNGEQPPAIISVWIPVF